MSKDERVFVQLAGALAEASCAAVGMNQDAAIRALEVMLDAELQDCEKTAEAARRTAETFAAFETRSSADELHDLLQINGLGPALRESFALFEGFLDRQRVQKEIRQDRARVLDQMKQESPPREARVVAPSPVDFGALEHMAKVAAEDKVAVSVSVNGKAVGYVSVYSAALDPLVCIIARYHAVTQKELNPEVSVVEYVYRPGKGLDLRTYSSGPS